MTCLPAFSLQYPCYFSLHPVPLDTPSHLCHLTPWPASQHSRRLGVYSWLFPLSETLMPKAHGYTPCFEALDQMSSCCTSITLPLCLLRNLFLAAPSPLPCPVLQRCSLYLLSFITFLHLVLFILQKTCCLLCLLPAPLEYKYTVLRIFLWSCQSLASSWHMVDTNKSLLAEYKFSRQSMVYYGSTRAKKLIVKNTTSEKSNNEMELDFIWFGAVCIFSLGNKSFVFFHCSVGVFQ